MGRVRAVGCADIYGGDEDEAGAGRREGFDGVKDLDGAVEIDLAGALGAAFASCACAEVDGMGIAECVCEALGGVVLEGEEERVCAGCGDVRGVVGGADDGGGVGVWAGCEEAGEAERDVAVSAHDCYSGGHGGWMRARRETRRLK